MTSVQGGMNRSEARQNEMAGATELLAFQGVERVFGRLKALAGVDFSVAPGEFVGLFAPAGSGKTAILNLSMGLGAPDRGRITFNGVDVARHPSSLRTDIGAVMGASDLEPDRSVRSNLRLAADLYGLRRHEAEVRAANLLRRFHLAEHERDLVRSLGDVQRRRIAVLRAVLHRPRLLLLNGIAEGLEPGPAAALMAEIRRLCQEEATTIIWATDRELEVGDADRLLILHRGRIAFEGSPGDLLARTGQNSLTTAIGAVTGLEAAS